MIRMVMAEVWASAEITATTLEPVNPDADRVGLSAGIVATGGVATRLVNIETSSIGLPRNAIREQYGGTLAVAEKAAPNRCRCGE